MEFDNHIRDYFGEYFLSFDNRKKSYDYIETYISDNVLSWDIAPDTDVLTDNFLELLDELSNSELVFLICHSGYIPEFYRHDSSQETLYSKLAEALVCEWAKRIGFVDSTLQKQKSSKEDISIKIGNRIIVCDAKCFRLGRSQAAPNVKDTIKKADYEKWLSSYKVGDRIGGLITFPSLHLWAKSSDVFSYVSDGTTPIVLLVYEQMSYFLYKEIGHQKLIDLMENYPILHRSTSKSPINYFTKTLSYLFGENMPDWEVFNSLCFEIIKERVNHTINKVETYLTETKASIREKVESIPVEELKQNLIDSQVSQACDQLEKQLYNITVFRPH